KVRQHVGVGAQREAVDRRVADHALAEAPEARVVVDDQKLARLREEVVQRADHHHVQVQKQGGAGQAVQVGLEGGELLPGAVALSRGQGLSCRFSGGIGRQRTSGRTPLAASVRQLNWSSPARWRRTMPYRRLTYSGPYLVPHFMHRIWRWRLSDMRRQL